MMRAGNRALGMLMALSLGTSTAVAARDDYDIDLKDLRPAGTSARPPKSPRQSPSLEIDLKELRAISPPPHAKAPPHRSHSGAPAMEAGTVPVSKEESIHVVRPGEFLFQILKTQYGLTEPAAERLIPEVRRMNGITSVRGLKIGQRLRIPLPARTGKQTIPPPGSGQDQHELTPAPPRLDSAVLHPKNAAQPSAPVTISLVSTHPCQLAHDLLEKAGLLTPPATSIFLAGTVRATSDGRDITVACGLSTAERYTYQRLLTHGGRQLLFFDQGESAERVVEQLAAALGLGFSKHAPHPGNPLVTYSFDHFGRWAHEVRLTISPAPASPQDAH